MTSAAWRSSALGSSITPFTMLFSAVLSSCPAAVVSEEVFPFLMGFTCFFFDIWHLRKQILLLFWLLCCGFWFAGNVLGRRGCFLCPLRLAVPLSAWWKNAANLL